MKEIQEDCRMFGKKTSVKRGLKIIIVGCGKVGVTLVEQLSKEGHDITIVDKNAGKIQKIANYYDIMGLAGNGASFSVQMEAGIEKADLFIAVTESDELNLLCCTVAKQVGDCATIARVRTPDYSQEAAYLREKLGLTMIINPELEAAREAARILFLPSALETHPFARGQAELIKFAVPDNNVLDGMTIAQMGEKLAKEVLVCAVERGEDVYIPDGDFQIQKGDILSFVAPRKRRICHPRGGGALLFSRNAGDHPQAKKPRFLFKRRLCGDGVKLDHHEYFRQSAILSDRNGADFCGRHV